MINSFFKFWKVFFLIAILLMLAACSQTSNSIDLETDISSTGEVAEIELVELTNNRMLTTQLEMDKILITEISSGAYSKDNPFIILDPYNISPLSALISFNTEQSCMVNVTIPGRNELGTFSHSFQELGTLHQIPVYALYPGTVNEIELELMYEDGTSEVIVVPIETEPLPDDFVQYDITSNSFNESMSNRQLLYMSSAVGAFYPFAVDPNGDVRWYSSNKGFSGGIFRYMEDGRYLALNEAIYAPAFIRGGAVVLDRMGKVYEQFFIDLTHHDVIELPNGNLLADSLQLGSEIPFGPIMVGKDRLIEIDRETGEHIQVWDLNEICGFTDEDIQNGRFMHTNSVWYEESDNSIMVSSPTVMAVVKFDAETKEIIWAIGDPQNNYPEPIQSKIPTPVGEGFEWNGSQHAAMVTPNGTILIHDNGSGRLDSSANPIADIDNYTRLVEYRIDEQEMTIEQLYQYGKERGNELFATYVGDVDYLDNNHYLLTAGGRVVNEEGVAAGAPFDAFMNISTGESKIVEIKDDEVVFEVYIQADELNKINNTYRAEWGSVYGSDETEYNLLDFSPAVFGELAPSSTVEYSLPNEYDALSVTVSPYNYGYQINVPVFSDDLEPNDKLYMELSSETNTLYYTTSGLGGLFGIVRSIGLESGSYRLGFVLIKEDGTTQYTQTEYVWNVD